MKIDTVIRWTFVLSLIVAALAAPARAHMAEAGGLSIIHPWASPGVSEALVHPTLANDSEEDLEIVGASSSAAETVRFVLAGAAVDRVRLAAGEVLASPDLVLALEGLVRPLTEGGHIELTLELGDGRSVAFHVVVGETSAMRETQ